MRCRTSVRYAHLASERSHTLPYMRLTVSVPSQTSSPALLRVRAAGAVALAAVLSLAMWTVVPLGWVWIASQVAPTQFPRLVPYLLCLVGTGMTMVGLGLTVARLASFHDRLYRPNAPPLRKQVLDSLSDQRTYRPPSAIERVMFCSIALALTSAVVWFLLFSGSPLWA